MIETFLWRFVEHRQRNWIVITVTAAILLLLVLPAVDNYNAARGRLKNLRTDLASMQSTVNQAGKYAELLQQRQTQLAALQQQTFSPSSVDRFRGELVERVRELGCQLRRIRVGDPILQTEIAASLGDPTQPASAKSESKLEIYGQSLSLQVTGPIQQINEIAKWIHDYQGMLQTQLFSLKKSDENPELSNLDLDLILLDLRPPKGKNT